VEVSYAPYAHTRRGVRRGPRRACGERSPLSVTFPGELSPSTAVGHLPQAHAMTRGTLGVCVDVGGRPVSATTLRPGSSNGTRAMDRPSSAVIASGMLLGMLSPRTALETLDLDDLKAMDEDVLEDDGSSSDDVDEEQPFSL
jgi:hypothetical protein